MYLLEYVFIMLVIRLIKILIDVDYCNIFFKADSKRARWIVCIIVYVAAAFTDIIFNIYKHNRSIYSYIRNYAGVFRYT